MALMAEAFVKVMEELGDDDSNVVELPCDDDGTLLLSTLQAQFAGASGLRYVSEGGSAIRGVRLDNNKLYPPYNTGWGSEPYHCVFTIRNDSKFIQGMQRLSCVDLIIHYFFEGYSYKEITEFLYHLHGIQISLRHLKRILKNNGLKRKCPESPIEDIVLNILIELTGSGSCLGYKNLWRRLKKYYSIQVKRSTVEKFVKIIDPERVAARSKHRLKRRDYVVPGPNFVWHIDGYDKLKPFGFAIHGAIDGFSRKILWLKVGSSNNNPRIIALYYLQAIRELNFVPTLIRTDRGTENSIMGTLQCYLRSDHDDKLSGVRSFIKGKSTANQRIESYWSQMRRHGINWWISYFKDLRDSCQFNNGDELEIETLRYCFSRLIQMELDRIREEWNSHCIRKQKNKNELPVGKPNVLYFLPETVEATQFSKPLNEDKFNFCLKNYTEVSEMFCPIIKDIVSEISSSIVCSPTTVEEAQKLYTFLVTYYRSLELD